MLISPKAYELIYTMTSSFLSRGKWFVMMLCVASVDKSCNISSLYHIKVMSRSLKKTFNVSNICYWQYLTLYNTLSSSKTRQLCFFEAPTPLFICLHMTLSSNSIVFYYSAKTLIQFSRDSNTSNFYSPVDGIVPRK